MANSTMVSNESMMNMTNAFMNQTQLEILLQVAPQVVMIDRIVSPVWYCLGLMGNPISAVIWLSKKIRKTNSSAVYFGSMAIVQTIYLLLHMFVELENAWGVNTYHGPGLCEFINFIFIVPQYLVPMLVLGFTTERYIAVCHPFVKEKYCTVKRAKIVICCMATVSILIASLQLYIWRWGELGCKFRDGVDEFNIVWTWVTEMFIFGLLPIGCLIINVLVILEIKRISTQSAAHGQSNGSSNAASTTTLLSVSFYFICTLLPATIVYAIHPSIEQGPPHSDLESWSNDPVWRGYFTYLTIRKVVEEICLSNYAMYFVIYYTTGVYFRREFKCLFKLDRIGKKKSIGGGRAMTSDYSLVTSDGKTTTETIFVDSPHDH